MEMPDQTQEAQQGITRRSVLRKAAYTAPAVIAIAAAPQVALGSSGGHGGGWGGGKPKKGRGGGRGRGGRGRGGRGGGGRGGRN